MSVKTAIFTEENFRSSMDTVVKKWWNSAIRTVCFRGTDGTRLKGYCAVNPEASASIILLHGFTEYTEKFTEVMYYFYQEGYSVFMYDQRGHGKSGRKVKNPFLVYVGSFDEYVEDLNVFVTRVVRHYTPNARLNLYAHSMGGCVGALYLEKYPEIFSRAVLSSPMLKIDFGSSPMVLVNSLAVIAKIAGWGPQPAPGFTPYSSEPDFKHSCATSEARYLYHLALASEESRYHTSGASYGWVRAAMQATSQLQRDARLAAVPILICQAGLDNVVDNEGQNSFAEHAHFVTLVRFPTAKHEIFRSTEEVLELYYGTIFDFLR